MVRGRVFRFAGRVLPAALVLGVFGATQVNTAGALPTVPATLVSITVTPPVADVVAGSDEQFVAIGTYSDLTRATSPTR